MIFAVLLAALHARGESVRVIGIVRDGTTLQGIPYASVTLRPSGASVVTDSRGLFEILAPDNTTSISAASQGYAPAQVPFRHSNTNLYDIHLQPRASELRELVVTKQKYSKRNNPAVDFARRIRRARDLTDPRRNDYYNFDRYERISYGINNFDTTANSAAIRRMPYLVEHIDSSEIDGVPVLNLSVKETASKVNWRRQGHDQKTTVTGMRSNGVDEFMDLENVNAVLDELVPEIELYDREIKLLRNRFVSPLSPLAPDFYRFYLVDTAAVIPGSDLPQTALAFYPRNKSMFGFTGHIYVPTGDTTMFISRVEMAVSEEINLNYVKRLKIDQTFRRAPDGSRLKTADNLTTVLEVLPGTPQLYLSRKIAFSDHDFLLPANADSIFGRLGSSFRQDGAESRDSLFWEGARIMPRQEGERNIALLTPRLRSNKLFRFGEKALRLMEKGYVGTGKDSRFDIGPLNTIASYNSFEGLRLRLGGMTTANLAEHWFASGYGAYGFRDHRWKYGVEGEYSVEPKRYHPREFPVHSVRFGHRYDIDRLGSHYLYTNADNFVLSLERSSDRRFTYRRDSYIRYLLELRNNWSFGAGVQYSRQEATEFVPFRTAAGTVLNHFNQLTFDISLRWAPGEKFYQGTGFRIPIDDFAPVFMLRHSVAPAGFASSRYNINRTEFTFSKRFSLSILGAVDTSVLTGHIWGKAPFTELFASNANLSYIIEPESFALMQPMEFLNSSYVSLFATWNLRGALFNLIPGVKRLGLREIITFSGLYGRLDSRCVPSLSNNLLMFPADAGATRMNKPYMEAGVGLDNILTCIRIDYVWRLNYRSVPHPVDRSGIRLALHFSF